MFGLSFLAPLFLAGALAAAVPIVLHLLRREEAPEVGLATTRFIKRAPVPRAKRRRLRDLLLLALRVAALMLIAAAFARPFFAEGVGTVRPTLTTIAIDTSFSMGGAAREAETRQLALDALARVPAGMPVAVMAFDDDARVLAEPSEDRALARAAIGQAAPGYGGTNYQALMAAASAAFGARTGTLVVISDAQRIGWRTGRGSLPDGIDVQLETIAPVARNVSVRRATRDGQRVVAAVENHGSDPVTTRVSLATEGAVVETREVTVAAGRTVDVTFEKGLPAAGVVRVVVVDPEGLPADDARFLLLDPPAPVPVVVLAQGGPRDDLGFFVSRALAVADPAEPIRVESVGGARGDNAQIPALTPSHVVMLLAARGVDRQVRTALVEHLTAGGHGFLALGPVLDPVVASDLLGPESGVRVLDSPVSNPPLHMTPLEARHPLFRGFGDAAASLSRVSVTRAFELQPGTATVLARFNDGRPALLEATRGRGRLLVFASDLDGVWNDFPRRAAFVPFVQEVVRYLAQGRTQARELLVSDVPPGIERRPGAFRRPGSDVVLVANVESEESNTLVASGDEFRREIEQAARATDAGNDQGARQQEDGQSLWRYGLWAALAVLGVESLFGRLWG